MNVALHVCAQRLKLFRKVDVASVDVMQGCNFRIAFRYQSGQDQSCTCAQICSGYLAASQLGSTLDDGATSLNLDIGVHPTELLDMHEAIFKNRLCHNACTLGNEQQSHHL
ncbi:Uncharacterised protein [Mycobacterium tuberculosis]|nr:Uncharacterised protein [Mycobacterium tuberculosis]